MSFECNKFISVPNKYPFLYICIKMDIIKSIKSWKPRNGFQRKTKSLSHSQQQQNLQTIQRMNDAENEIIQHDELLLNNKVYVTPNRTEQEYWTNESISSNASTTNFPMKEEISSGSVSSGSGMTNNCSRIATTLPAGNQALSIFQDMRDAGILTLNTDLPFISFE